ncbi:MAG TPA: hypothetical protein VII84_08155, partial [Acidimicrobiales bacterium]
TLAFDGLDVTTGADRAAVTLKVAGLVVAEPWELVNVASYSLPFIALVTEFNVRVLDVAPVTAVNVAPPFVETLHCTLGVGEPVAAALNVAFDPTLALALNGLVVTTGADRAVVTVKVAAVVVAEPLRLVKTASYRYPFIALVTEVNVRFVEKDLDTVVNVAPPLVETLHCTPGVGEPVAAALKLAFDPALTLTLVGLSVTTGADEGAAPARPAVKKSDVSERPAATAAARPLIRRTLIENPPPHRSDHVQ